MRQRTIKKQIWLNEDEDKMLKEKSKLAGLSESELIRSFIKGYTIKEQPNGLVKQFLTELSRIGNNINQIARAANTYQYVDIPECKEVIAELSNCILEITKKIYSRER